MSEKFDKAYWARARARGFTFEKLLPILSRRLDRIEKYVKGKARVRVLDLGCGFGYFLKLCDHKGWETYGMETSYFAIEIAKKNTKAQLYQGNIEDQAHVQFERNYFDLVSMFEVLEHLKYPPVALRRAHRLLKLRGKLVVTTPNLNAIMRVFSKLSGRERGWYGFLDETHVNLFTPSLLRSFVEEVGFKVLELKTPFYHLPWQLNRIFGKAGLGGQILLLAEKGA